MRPRSLLLAVSFAAAIVAACETARVPATAIGYIGAVEALLETRCLRCHADSAPAAGWSVSSYVHAIGCVRSGEAVTRATTETLPPLLRALDRPDHAGLVTSTERTLLADWIRTGASRSGAGVHSASFADPRSPESHGAFLRERRFAPMLDPSDADACGACHDGTPSRRESIQSSAPDAPSCTSCHTEPGGPLACGTCHGDGAQAYPPRDRCFFPGDAADPAHAAHAEPGATHASGFACTTCHPAVVPGQLSGLHANGWVDVQFDFPIAGRNAKFDPAAKRCSGTCHDRGGDRPTPAWNEGATTCNDCHRSPPRDHYEGACSNCHRGVDTDGSKLVSSALHANGKVDLGDGSGRCGACHGQGDDPWPATGAHAAHAKPSTSRPVACETCHEAPNGERHPVGKSSASVRLGGLSTHGGRRASFDPTTKTCAGTYCHEGSGGTRTAPRWDDPTKATCASCHGSPPAPPHVQSATCGGVGCHEGRTANGTLSATGRLDHLDGVIDRSTP